MTSHLHVFRWWQSLKRALSTSFGQPGDDLKSGKEEKTTFPPPIYKCFRGRKPTRACINSFVRRGLDWSCFVFRRSFGNMSTWGIDTSLSPSLVFTYRLRHPYLKGCRSWPCFHIALWLHRNIYIYVCIFIFICIYVQHVYIYTHKYIWIQIKNIYTYIYIHLHRYAYIYTHGGRCQPMQCGARKGVALFVGDLLAGRFMG